jgi:hypothetical protein
MKMRKGLASKLPPTLKLAKQVAQINQSDTVPNPGANPLEPMSRILRSVPTSKVPDEYGDINSG